MIREEELLSQPARLGERLAELLVVALGVAWIVCIYMTWFN